MYTEAAEAGGKWESRGCLAGFPSEVGKSIFDFSPLLLFHSFSRREIVHHCALYLGVGANLQLSTFPFPHYNLGLCGSMMVTVALNLQQTTTVAHHPIMAEGTLRFQAEDFLQPPQTRFATMKIFFRGSCAPADRFPEETDWPPHSCLCSGGAVA